MATNRNKNVKYEDDWEEDYQEDEDIDEYEEDLDIQDIQAEMTYDLDTESIRKVLRQHHGDIDDALDYLEDYKDKILKDQEKARQKKEKANQHNKPIKDKKNGPAQIVKAVEEQIEDFNMCRKRSRKISKEVLDLLEAENEKKEEEYKVERDLKQYNGEYKDRGANAGLWAAYEEKTQKEKKGRTVNLVVAGHVDSGKSTLIGNLLYSMQVVEEKAMRKLEKEAKLIDKESFKYAWVTDSSELERQKGVTIEVGYRQFQLDIPQGQVVVNIMDTPGHRDFVPNMITGAAQADLAILVLDSCTDAFEAGFLHGGQTREHVLLLKGLGLQRVIFAVNKQDQTEWSQDRFNQIKAQMEEYLQSVGSFEEVVYVPLSGRLGQNVVGLHPQQDWYQGPCLVDVLKGSAERVLARNKAGLHLKPTRVTISNLYHNSEGFYELKGHCFSGKVESGVLQSRKGYVIMPQGVLCQIRDILVNELAGNAQPSHKQKAPHAMVGQMVDCALILHKPYEFNYLAVGSMVSELEYVVPISRRFSCEMLTYEMAYPILKGANLTLHLGLNKVKASVKSLGKILDKATGEAVKKNLKCVKSHECCQLDLALEQMVPLELFSNIPGLGRVTLRDRQHTIAVGIVKLIQ